jgi:hypothetical protein
MGTKTATLKSKYTNSTTNTPNTVQYCNNDFHYSEITCKVSLVWTFVGDTSEMRNIIKTFGF